mgnify:CR=1 FL=1
MFRDEAKVKVQLRKVNESEAPLPGAIFSIYKDGQLIGTQATDAEGTITVPNVTEGFYYFIQFEAESSAPAEIESRIRIMDNVLRYLVVKNETK